MLGRPALFFSVLAYFTFSSAIHAQSETVPKELMSILMRGPGTHPSDSFDLRVGPPPKDFPLEVLPKGTDVGVSAISERMTTVVGRDHQCQSP